MAAAARILAEVIAYRVRRLEMANLVAAVGLMLALRLPWRELIFRSAFSVVLNVLAYTTNDYYDVERDLAARRAPEKSRYLAEHRRAALGAQLGLALVLFYAALYWNIELIVPTLAGAGLCWLYSARLKGVPYADIVLMALWGIAMPLVAIPLDSKLGWALVIELGLFSACFETIQVIRDVDQDRKARLETSAVRLGTQRTLRLSRVLMLLAAAYAVLVLHRYIGLALLVAPLLPFTAPAAYWNRVRFVFGLVWLLLLGWVYRSGSTAGLLGLF
jgi:4-hydroxybenzoate polyprenyltransferase